MEEAKELPAMLKSGASNTYVCVSLCPLTGSSQQCTTPQYTAVQYNTVNPAYKHKCRLLVSPLCARYLQHFSCDH